MAESRPPVRHLVLAVVGVVLLAGGGYGVVVGAGSVDECGSSTLVANELADPSGEVVGFENLTGPQQDLVRQSVERDPPTVTGDEWPWFESALVVQYRGTYYEMYTVTAPCPFPPGAVLLVASLTAVLGASMLAPAGLWVARSRRSE